MLVTGRLYHALIDAISVSAVCDLFWIGCPTDAITLIHEILVTQDTSETSEQLPLNIFRTTTDNAAQGTANTPNPVQVGDPAYGGTVRTNITGASLSAETTMIWRESQNILNGWRILFPRPIILTPAAATAGRLAIKIDAAPGSALPISACVKLEEVGG